MSGRSLSTSERKRALALVCYRFWVCSQGWMAAVQVSRDKGTTTAVVAAAAMFVLVVTRSNDEWASWSEHDNMFVR